MPLLALLPGLVVFVAAFMASGSLVRRALGSLDDAERLRFVDLVTSSRNYAGLIAYFVLVGGWLAAFTSLPAHAPTIHLVFLGGVMALLVAFVLRGDRRTVGMPPAFRRSMRLASILRVVGFAALLVTLAWPIVAGSMA